MSQLSTHDVGGIDHPDSCTCDDDYRLRGCPVHGDGAPMEPHVQYVNAYEVTLGYGGPEEGGWWYDVGTPLASIPIDRDNAEADEAEAREMIERCFKPRFAGNPGRHSVMGGAADLLVCREDDMAEAYPAARPFYE